MKIFKYAFLICLINVGMAFAQLSISPGISSVTYDVARDTSITLPDVTLTNNGTGGIFWNTNNNTGINIYPAVGYLPAGATVNVVIQVNASTYSVGNYYIPVNFLSKDAVITGGNSWSISYGITLTVVDSRTFVVTNKPIIPHVASGAEWKTVITLLNPSPTASLVDIKFYDPTGQPTTFTVDGVPRGDYLTVVSAYGTSTITLFELTGPVKTGSLEFQTLYGQDPKAFANYVNNSFEAFISADVPNSSSMTIGFDNTGTNRTGLALGNYLNFAQDITLTFYDYTGVLLDTQIMRLNPYGQSSFELSQTFSKISGKRGIVKISAARNGLSGFAFKFNLSKGYFVTSPKF